MQSAALGAPQATPLEGQAVTMSPSGGGASKMAGPAGLGPSNRLRASCLAEAAADSLSSGSLSLSLAPKQLLFLVHTSAASYRSAKN